MKVQSVGRQGFAHIAILVVIAGVFVILGITAGAYYYLKTTRPSVYAPQTSTRSTAKLGTPVPTAGTQSSDKTTDLQTDLNATTINSIDTDLKSLDASASSL